VYAGGDNFYEYALFFFRQGIHFLETPFSRLFPTRQPITTMQVTMFTAMIPWNLSLTGRTIETPYD
jgi:hypothetical protein